MSKKWLVRWEILGEKQKSYCMYYLAQEDWIGGTAPLPFTSLTFTPKFSPRVWWKLQKGVIAQRLLESAK